jgi:hypothetical protein
MTPIVALVQANSGGAKADTSALGMGLAYRIEDIDFRCRRNLPAVRRRRMLRGL